MLVEQLLPSTITAETLSMIAGVILTLAFSYVPGLREWFKNLGVEPSGADDGTKKRLVMLALLAVIAFAMLLLICVPTLHGYLVSIGIPVATCDGITVANYLSALVAAIIANQGVYAISPRKAIRTPLRAMKQPDDAKG